MALTKKQIQDKIDLIDYDLKEIKEALSNDKSIKIKDLTLVSMMLQLNSSLNKLIANYIENENNLIS